MVLEAIPVTSSGSSVEPVNGLRPLLQTPGTTLHTISTSLLV